VRGAPAIIQKGACHWEEGGDRRGTVRGVGLFGFSKRGNVSAAGRETHPARGGGGPGVREIFDQPGRETVSEA